jgi:phasin
MNDSFNPQEAGAQATHTYRNLTARLGLLGLNTDIPESVRDLAETTVGQTREIHDRSIDAFEASVATFELLFDAAGQGAAAFNRKIVDIARRNVETSFDLATSLAGAKDFADMVRLQAAYWQKQIGTLTAQAEEVRALSTKVAADTAESIKAQMPRGVDGRHCREP